MLILAFALLAASPGTAAISIPQVQAYVSILKRLQLGQANGSVEATFDAAIALGDTMLQEKDDTTTLLESLSDAEFVALGKTLPGILLQREEVLIVEPDPTFFLALAKKYGGRTDVEFFRNYLATLPGGVWPSWDEQQTDYSGCTAFGRGELVKRYAGWLAFRSKYPHAYSEQVADELTDIESEVGDTTCACGSKDEVLHELQEFADTFPTSPVIRKVLKRIHELKESTSPIRFNCISG
jgi:hypothetical protein